MAANNLGRYVWLVNTLLKAHRPLTFKQISDRWEDCGLSYGEPLPRTTFNNHRQDILDIFGVEIMCNRKDNTYYIDRPEKIGRDTLRSWILDSFSVLNQIGTDTSLEKMIVYEDIPSGREFLSDIIDAIRSRTQLTVEYKSFKNSRKYTALLEPYCLRVCNRRWYVVGRNYGESKGKGKDIVRVYALDRIECLEENHRDYEIPDSFDADKFFEDFVGVYCDPAIPSEHVVLKVYGKARDYVETLPIHHSQNLIDEDEDSLTFEYRLKPTCEFYQQILRYGGDVELVEPTSMREEINSFAKKILERHSK